MAKTAYVRDGITDGIVVVYLEGSTGCHVWPGEMLWLLARHWGVALPEPDAALKAKAEAAEAALAAAQPVVDAAVAWRLEYRTRDLCEAVDAYLARQAGEPEPEPAPAEVVCPDCGGEGHHHRTCITCGGTGKVTQEGESRE